MTSEIESEQSRADFATSVRKRIARLEWEIATMRKLIDGEPRPGRRATNKVPSKVEVLREVNAWIAGLPLPDGTTLASKTEPLMESDGSLRPPASSVPVEPLENIE